WRLKDMLDFHVDDATIDVLDIPVDASGMARGHSMFAVAARNAVIQARQALFAAADMDLTVIDIPEMAQRNISAVLETEGRGLAMLSFDGDGGLLTITFKGELYLSRRIDVTLQQLLEPDTDKQQACFDKITLELQRSLDHFDRQFNYVNVIKLLLAPTGAPGLHEYLAANLYMPVEAMELEDVFDLSKAPALLDVEQQRRFFLTLGAALRHEEVAL
ncbi:MAG TPA: agglutinin biogenesis protein MshI, partial [Duganella sp.]